MRDLSQAILADVQSAVAPTEAGEYMPDAMRASEDAFVWVRPPSTNEGPFRHVDAFRGGILYIDLFAPSWEDIDALEEAVAFLDPHTVLTSGDARNIRFEKGSAIPVFDDADAGTHLSIAYDVSYVDTRSIA